MFSINQSMCLRAAERKSHVTTRAKLVRVLSLFLAVLRAKKQQTKEE
jgi:hypothetical protein